METAASTITVSSALDVMIAENTRVATALREPGASEQLEAAASALHSAQRVFVLAPADQGSPCR